LSLPLAEGIIGKRDFGGVRKLPWFYYVARVIVVALFFLLTRLEVKGRENIPGQGPMLVVANHLNLADPPLLGISLGKKAVFMAKEELFRSRFAAYFIGSFGSFPVHRRKLDRQAMRRAEQVLADGLALVMFPEATRSQSARLQTALPGSALIAMRCGVPILPVGIAGSEKIKGLSWILRRPHITVNIGRPFYLPSFDGRWARAELIQHTDFIMRRIAELLPPQYRGVYGD
jgi:1-acyl-sn-glycerol-3-phosphate acyltransferase